MPVVCPNGLLLNDDEVKVCLGALTNTLEYVQEIINSETRPNRRYHDDEYLKKMRALKESKRDYAKMLTKLERAQKSKAKRKKPF